MREIKAPDNYPLCGKASVFLAGSIEMGKAEKWQDTVVQELKDLDCIVYNPRRDDWDSSWVQNINNASFHEQVCWEQNHIYMSDIVYFYFSPGTQSPITLLELGQVLGSRRPNVIVCCPDGFWRKGNVDIVCKYQNIKVYDNFENSIQSLYDRVKEFNE